MGRAIGADRFIIVAHIDKNMRMIEGWQSADAHEFLGADAKLCDTRLIVEMRRDMSGHDDVREGGNLRQNLNDKDRFG
jgi:hypothetical protein